MGAILQLRKTTGLDLAPVLLDRTQPEDKENEPWRVLLHNDSYTPMDYVVNVLHDIFSLGWLQATWIMMKAHVAGEAEVGSYPAAEAERRVAAALTRARADGWPLLLSCGPPG